MVDINGKWIQRVDRGYEMGLFLARESADLISGKLIIDDHSWVEFQGALQQGRYLLEGTRFLDRGRFVFTEQLLGDVQSYDIPNPVLEVLESWKGRRFRSKGNFLAGLRKELSVREQRLEKRKKDLEKLERKLEWLDKKVKKAKSDKSRIKPKGDPGKLQDLEVRFRNAKEAYNRKKEELDRHRCILEEDNLDGDYVDNLCQKIATLIEFETSSASSKFEVGGRRRYTGWLTMTPGDHKELLLWLAAPRKESRPETPWVFARASR
jgi:hypothetical protein